MKIAKNRQELSNCLNSEAAIGFVPTMGALHEGHLSLVKESKDRGLTTVASIFVNPTQFNDPKDFEKYPIDAEADLEKLESVGCDVVFLPPREEIYLAEENKNYIHDFGALETRFEGAFRPGHFKGVGQVVHILFELVKPNVAFFGQKDFQQLQVIKRLVEQEKLPIEIVGMPTIRETDGLAMSSRNRRLTASQRSAAVLLFEALNFAKTNVRIESFDAIRKHASSLFAHSPELELEYFDIIHPENFIPADKFNEEAQFHAVISAYAGEIRLIDNMQLA